MKKILLYVSLLVVVGCDNFLDIRPKGYTIPSTYEDFRRLMNDAQYMAKAGDYYPSFITDDIRCAGGDLKGNFTSLDDNLKNLYSFAHGSIFSEGEEDIFWHRSYKRIYTCNAVINNIMDVDDASEADKKNLQAEALLARAFEFLSLIGCYAPAYDANTAEEDYGIPLILSEDIDNLNYKRNRVAEVYRQVLSDLEKARPFLSDEIPNTFRPSKKVASGILARMYLMQGNYEKALECAKASLEKDEELVDMKEYVIKDENTMIGRIVRKDDPSKVYPEGIDNPENIYVRYCPSVFGIYGKAYVSTDLLNVYSKDLPGGAVDKRRELWFCDDQFLDDEFPGYTIVCSYIRQNLAVNAMELLLTAAECYVRIGGAENLNEAAKLYNGLRDHRIGNNVHVTFADKEEALVRVLEERRREFAFVGSYRFIDLKRLNKDSRFAKTIVHEVDGNVYDLPANDNRYILPIPPVVKGFRPDLPDYER